MTTAGRLPCKSVFHAVGPTWRGGAGGEELMLQVGFPFHILCVSAAESALLKVAVRNCLTKADSMGYTTISLPAISSGIFGFPKVLQR